MTKKTMLIAACLILLSITVGRAEKALVITFTDATTAMYLLSEKPIITFKEGNMVVTSDITEAAFDRSIVSQYAIVEQTPTAIVEVKSAIGPIEVSVYDTSGTCVYHSNKNSDTPVALPQGKLHSGVYVVSINGKSHKLVVNR